MTAFICILLGASLFVYALWYGVAWAVKADAEEERARLWAQKEKESSDEIISK